MGATEREVLGLVEEAATGEDTIRAPIELSQAELDLLNKAIEELDQGELYSSQLDTLNRLRRRLEGVGMMLGGMQGLRDDIKSGKINLDDYK